VDVRQQRPGVDHHRERFALDLEMVQIGQQAYAAQPALADELPALGQAGENIAFALIEMLQRELDPGAPGLLAGDRKRIGQLLVDKGALGPDALARGLRHQVNEIFLGLLVARSGTFVFLRGLDRTQLPSILALDTQAMLLDGLRRLDEMELYRTRVPSSELTPKVLRKASPTDVLTPEQLQVLEQVDGHRTIADIATATALGEFEATKAAFKLLENGILSA
jgi:hypothetical protein